MDDYALVTVYVCQTLYDQLFRKQKVKDREQPGRCRKSHTACKWLYNKSENVK